MLYSPFLKCGGTAYGKHDGRLYCLHHLLMVKQNEECAICLCDMRNDNKILLSCGHMFHVNCLSECREPECPLCRRQLAPAEALGTMGRKHMEQIGNELYSLPKENVKIALSAIQVVLKVCSYAPHRLAELIGMFPL